MVIVLSVSKDRLRQKILVRLFTYHLDFYRQKSEECRCSAYPPDWQYNEWVLLNILPFKASRIRLYFVHRLGRASQYRYGNSVCIKHNCNDCVPKYPWLISSLVLSNKLYLYFSQLYEHVIVNRFFSYTVRRVYLYLYSDVLSKTPGFGRTKV